MLGHEDCAHDSTFGEVRDCIARQIEALGDPGLLAQLDQLNTHVAFRRNEALFGEQ
jgi:hypothetical protein